jgi:hypothetical protein
MIIKINGGKKKCKKSVKCERNVLKKKYDKNLDIKKKRFKTRKRRLKKNPKQEKTIS